MNMDGVPVCRMQGKIMQCTGVGGAEHMQELDAMTPSPLALALPPLFSPTTPSPSQLPKKIVHCTAVQVGHPINKQ